MAKNSNFKADLRMCAMRKHLIIALCTIALVAAQTNRRRKPKPSTNGPPSRTTTDFQLPDISSEAPFPDVSSQPPDTSSEAPFPDVSTGAPFPDVSTGTPFPDVTTGDPFPDASTDAPQDVRDVVQQAFREAVAIIEERRGVNRLLRGLGIDGKETKVDKYNKRRDQGHSDTVIDLGEIVLQASIQLVNITNFDIDDILANPLVQANVAAELCPDGPPQKDCDKGSQRFRTYTGICNNKQNYRWGSALSTEPRYLPADYDDQLSSPRKAVQGGDLPSPRFISNRVFQARENVTVGQGFNTLMSMCWGQFLDHDFVLSPVAAGDDHESITCCINDVPADRPECQPIEIPSDDPHFTTTCMPFVRSAAAPQEDMCSLGSKEVLNEITAFIDASNVYGSSNKQALNLRNRTEGLLDVLSFDDDTEMLPEDLSPESICVLSDDDDYCQLAGDVRVNVQPGLGGLHLLFVREHQRIVRRLAQVRPKWKDGRLYQEARKIVGALMQQITYGEYLPLVLTSDKISEYGLKLMGNGFSDDYDPDMNPNIRNEFAAAVFRFGHSQIPDKLAYMLADYNSLDQETAMNATLLDPKLLTTNGGKNVAGLTRFIITQDAKRVDSSFESAIRNTLFGTLDLTSLNIQRGRDHGVPAYVHFRRYCGLSVPTNFAEMSDIPERTRDRIARAYQNVEDVDLYVGGISELPLGNGVYLGATFSCLLGEQFQALKVGDRFWYERDGPEGFSSEQLDQIRKVKLSKILCNNFGMDDVQPDVFHQPRG
ncbi:hypothetical protein FSP39_014520 [Pinctada imbricata]|uniref:Peroxidase n=1 Tax=Pinctada imbricata TaxID=66713 RepID=A0AA88YNX8_PINIB|nr:hypothetical protein FSP39_014520 [Pinctada imbricata]